MWTWMFTKTPEKQNFSEFENKKNLQDMGLHQYIDPSLVMFKISQYCNLAAH